MPANPPPPPWLLSGCPSRVLGYMAWDLTQRPTRADTHMFICVYVCLSVLLSIRPFSERLLHVPVVKPGAGWWPQQTQSRLTLTVHREPHLSFSTAGLPHMSLNRGVSMSKSPHRSKAK